MINFVLMLITVATGLFLIYCFRNKYALLRIISIILVFGLARIFFGFEWKSVTGNINIVSLGANFYLLLLFNFVLLSLIFIFGNNYLTKQNLKLLGWNKDNLFKNLIIGFVIGILFFLILIHNKPIHLENLPIAMFFGFFIASWQEENIFRGYLIEYFQNKFNFGTTLILQALIYSLAHIGFYSFFPLANFLLSLMFAFFLGLVFGYLKMKTKSQIPGFISHGIIDVAFLI